MTSILSYQKWSSNGEETTKNDGRLHDIVASILSERNKIDGELDRNLKDCWSATNTKLYTSSECDFSSNGVTTEIDESYSQKIQNDQDLAMLPFLPYSYKSNQSCSPDRSKTLVTEKENYLNVDFNYEKRMNLPEYPSPIGSISSSVPSSMSISSEPDSIEWEIQQKIQQLGIGSGSPPSAPTHQYEINLAITNGSRIFDSDAESIHSENGGSKQMINGYSRMIDNERKNMGLHSDHFPVNAVKKNRSAPMNLTGAQNGYPWREKDVEVECNGKAYNQGAFQQRLSASWNDRREIGLMEDRRSSEMSSYCRDGGEMMFPNNRQSCVSSSPSLRSMQMQQHAASALMHQNAAQLQQKHLQLMMQGGRIMDGNNQGRQPQINHSSHHHQHLSPPGFSMNSQLTSSYEPLIPDNSRLGHGFPSSHFPTGYLDQFMANRNRNQVNNLPCPGGYSQSLPQSMYRGSSNPPGIPHPPQTEPSHSDDHQNAFMRALAVGFEQLKNLERERKKTEAELAGIFPGKRVSSSCNSPMPKSPNNPTKVDKLIADQQREHGRVKSLIERMEHIIEGPMPAYITNILEVQYQCIRDVSGIRSQGWDQKNANFCSNGQGSTTSHLLSSVKSLTHATKKTRSGLWCALQFTLKKA